MKDLNLARNRIYDISALADLKNLETLDIFGNFISDYTPVAALTQLKELHIGSIFLDIDDRLFDVSILSGLTQLEVLDLQNNDIVDVSPLATLTQLSFLGLPGNFISDISSLTVLTALKVLDLRDNRLNTDALNKHIPAMETNGTEFRFGYR